MTRSDFFRNQQGKVVPGEVEDETRLINFPTLLRVGLGARLELRVNSNVYNLFRRTFSGSTDDGSTTVDTEGEAEGFPGLTVGAKAQVLDAPSYALSLVPRVALPIGDDAFTSDRAGFAADAVLGTALPRQIGLTLVAGASYDPVALPEDDYVLNGNLVAVASRSLGEQIGGYVEGAFQPRENAGNAAFLGAGLTYQPVPTAQLDAFFDRGLTADATDWIFGGGVSIRFGD